MKLHYIIVNTHDGEPELAHTKEDAETAVTNMFDNGHDECDITVYYSQSGFKEVKFKRSKVIIVEDKE